MYKTFVRILKQQNHKRYISESTLYTNKLDILLYGKEKNKSYNQ